MWAIWYKETYSLTSTPNDRFLRNFFMADLFTPTVSARNLLSGNRRRNIWSIHISCFTVVLCVLLQDYTMPYTHFFSYIFKLCYQIVWMKEMCICFSKVVFFVLSNCLNAKKIKLEWKIQVKILFIYDHIYDRTLLILKVNLF